MSIENSVDLEVLQSLLLNLVTDKDALKIDRDLDEQGVLLSVTVSASDMGIVIGKNGSMANAIKTLLRAVGKTNKMNVRVRFLEPDGSIRFAGKNRSDNGEIKQENNQEFKPKAKFEVKKDQMEYVNSLEDDLKDFVIN